MPINQLGVYWPFKTLLQGSGISLTEDATTIRITVTGGPTGGSGDMLQSQFATNGKPGVVDHAVLADTATSCTNAQTAANVPWTGVTGVPTSFPTDWSLITSKPTVFPPAAHAPTHRGKGTDPIAPADTNDSGLLALVSGKTTDYVGGDNQCHSLPATIQNFGALPPGATVPFAGATLPGAAGTFLWCDGSAVSRTTFSALFTALGGVNSPWGLGDGKTTFNVPDMRGCVPVGAGQGIGLTNRPLGVYGGEEYHQLVQAEMPAHGHIADVYDPGHNHNPLATDRNLASGTAFTGGLIKDPNPYGNTTYNVTNITVGIEDNGGDAPHNNMMPFFALNFIIKT